MAAIYPPQLALYIVRHGERLDHIDPNWAETAPTPYDPPLTPEGLQQASRTGQWIYSHEQRVCSGTALATTDYHILTSPFLRCTQTSYSLYKGFQSCLPWPVDATAAIRTNWDIAVEPGLSEWMSVQYFDAPVPRTIALARCNELKAITAADAGSSANDLVFNDVYTPISPDLPTYPESFQDMLARFRLFLGQLTARYLGTLGNAAQEHACRMRSRQVVILSTHAAATPALLWALTNKWERIVPFYCAVSYARLVPVHPLTAPIATTSTADDSRIGGDNAIDKPKYTWVVDYAAYDEHITAKIPTPSL
ncbi:hypothetical protein EV182_002174 [Spiromyces aspiralis]|uniref:Uncharacterized protein n=1 Tax=Spiromyces aspiralis TaxID=68401 RepID=A0ACC1HVW4_9FUNG|nr:hypothetical protein EV182_002174 [Spiromyces aspiralis]